MLYDGQDFVILDFEGEPAQPIEVRRLKRSALYDVCGMLRSFHYAATFALRDEAERAELSQLSELWYRWISAVYLGAYLREVRARAAGYDDEEVTVEALANELVPHHVPLRAKPAKLSVSGTAGARVAVDGKVLTSPGNLTDVIDRLVAKLG